MEITDIHSKVIKERIFESDKPLTIETLDGSKLEVLTCSVILTEIEHGAVIREAALKILLARGQDFTVTEKSPHLTFGHAFVLNDMSLEFVTNRHVTDWTLKQLRRFSDGELVLDFEHKM